MRDGVVASRREFTLEGVQEAPGELTAACLQQYYGSVSEVPQEIYTSVEPTDRELLEEWLSVKRGRAVKILSPRRGPKRAFLETVAENARLAFEQAFRGAASQGLEEAEALRESLDLEEPPLRIEAFDISNTQGTDSVASMVVWEAGKMRPAQYRHFRIRTVQGADDFASLAEVVGRRYARLLREGEELPDLVLIDGGKGQLRSAAEVLTRLDLVTLQVASIAKREEILYLQGRKGEIEMDHASAALHLIQRIRDEAHRFAVTYHRRLRSKRTLTTSLRNVPGVGALKARKLLTKFGSVRGVLSATDEDLAREVGPALAGKIRKHLSEAARPPDQSKRGR
jgi:excinuclease ABC subunit C